MSEPIADAATDVPMVDTHAHIYVTSMPLAATAWHRPPHDASIEQYLGELDAHGVKYAVLAAATLYDDGNAYQIEALRRHKRLRGTVIAHPEVDRRTLNAMKADGVVGIRFQWRNVAKLPDLTAPEYRALLGHVADLDWHVQLHDDSPRLARPLQVLAAAGVKVVVDHFGRPDQTQGVACEGFRAILRAVENGRTWVKLAAGFRLASPSLAVASARELLKHAGPERLMWGSDWPFAAFESTMTYQSAIDHLASWVPDPVARRRVAGETAFNFYFS